MEASLLALAKSIYYFVDVTNRYWLHQKISPVSFADRVSKKQQRIIVAGPNQVVYIY